MVRHKNTQPGVWAETKRAFIDMSTSADNSYDPARLIGYLIVILFCLFFLAGITYDTIMNHRFNGGDFAAGATSLGALLFGAAAGVRIKNISELPIQQQIPPPPQPYAPAVVPIQPPGPQGPPSC